MRGLELLGERKRRLRGVQKSIFGVVLKSPNLEGLVPGQFNKLLGVFGIKSQELDVLCLSEG